MSVTCKIHLDEDSIKQIIAERFRVDSDDVAIDGRRTFIGVGPMEQEVIKVNADVRVRGDRASEILDWVIK